MFSFAERPRPVVLLVLDGFGIAPDGEGNAITRASTPTIHMLTERYPVMTLKASSEEVGLLWGEMGNSEVGHLSLGAGRVYYQTLPRISKSIADGSFAKNPALLSALEAVKKTGGTLHLVGLLSSGRVHGSDEHCFAILEMAKKNKVKDVAVHAILDGRDTLYNSGRDFLHSLLEKMRELGVGRLATLCGRYFAMDRDNRWDRIQQAYKAMALGQAEHSTDDPLQTLNDAYARELYDEEFPPTVVTSRGGITTTVKPGDAVIFFNFRPDRMRELVQAFALPVFVKFPRDHIYDLTVVTMTEYEKQLPVAVAYPAIPLVHGLTEVISDAGFVQLHIAETEKYQHIAYFFNGRREEPFSHEDRVLIPSPAVASYDLAPEMSALPITERIIKELKTGNYDFILANFANLDMVGHTGNLEATIKAVETVDTCVGQIVDATLGEGGVVLVVADHGNAEEVLNVQTHAIDKEHSTNPVPLWIVGKMFEGQSSVAGDIPNGDLSLVPPVGILADVAPTILKIMGLEQPVEMTGEALI